MTDVNECARYLGTDLGCQNGATCFNLPGSYRYVTSIYSLTAQFKNTSMFRCDCQTGWFGLHCTKKDSICNRENSQELCGHGICIPKPGVVTGYICLCDQVCWKVIKNSTYNYIFIKLNLSLGMGNRWQESSLYKRRRRMCGKTPSVFRKPSSYLFQCTRYIFLRCLSSRLYRKWLLLYWHRRMFGG